MWSKINFKGFILAEKATHNFKFSYVHNLTQIIQREMMLSTRPPNYNKILMYNPTLMSQISIKSCDN